MDKLIDIILHTSIWSVAKVMVVFALLIYLIFAWVVVRQTNMMVKVVSGELNWLIKIIGWIHFLFALLVILLALVIL